MKQRRKTWLAAQVAARRSTHTSGTESIVEDDGHHVVVVDREAPRSEVDMVRSNFEVEEMMRFQLSKKLQSQSLEISIINNITLWGEMPFCFSGGGHPMSQFFGSPSSLGFEGFN